MCLFVSIVKGQCYQSVISSSSSDIANFVLLKVTCVNNPTVEKTITDNLAAAGVTVHTDCILARYNTTDDGSEVTSLDFTTTSHPLNVQCDVSSMAGHSISHIQENYLGLVINKISTV